MDQTMVCKYCIGNEHLSQFVYLNGSRIKCGFCGKIANCVTIESLCGEIIEAISFEYEDANGCMSWDKGFVGATTWYTNELLYDLNEDMQLEEKVLDAVCKNVHDITWCQMNPYSLRRHKEHHYMWQSFCEMVKHRTRYVFFRMPERYNHDMEESPYLILDHIAEAADKLGLFKTIKAGEHFFRGRIHKETEYVSSPSRLSSPPDNKAKANRMSAEGISVFYGADNAETVLDEISTDALCFATVARFRSLCDFNILDLTAICKFSNPSLFDKEVGQYREQIAFLHALEEDLTKPIKGEHERNAIEYVPTQVIAEYFRYLHEVKGKPIDGIAYRSAENDTGTCYVLFINQYQCLPDPPYPDKQQLQIVKRSYRRFRLSGHWESV